MKKAADFIDTLMESFQIDKHSSSINLFSSWQSIAGTDIGSHSTLKDIEGTTLIIEVDHPGWLQMVLLRKNQLLKGVNKAFPELGITDLRVVHQRKKRG